MSIYGVKSIEIKQLINGWLKQALNALFTKSLLTKCLLVYRSDIPCRPSTT